MFRQNLLANGRPLASANGPASGTKPKFVLLSQVKPQPVDWLWQGRIPLGELSIFDGDPGTNKSSLTLDLAARITTGRPMPDDSQATTGGVVLLQAEDSLHKTLPLRAKAAEADMSRIAVLEQVTIPADLSSIEQAVIGVKARLIIIDPLMVFLDANANKEQATRQALTPLRQLAERHNLAVVMVRHLNKSGGRQALYRGTGSIAFTAAVRSAFLVGQSPDDPNHRVLCHVKSNLGPISPSLLFEPLASEKGGLRIEWRGECDFKAEALLTASKDGQAARDRAMTFLLETLVDGPVAQKDIERSAIDKGIALRTLERAKGERKIVSHRRGFGRGSRVYWTLPTEDDLHTSPKPMMAAYDEDAACAEGGAQ